MTILEVNKFVNDRIREYLEKSEEFKNVPLLETELEEEIVRPSIKTIIGSNTRLRENSCLETIKARPEIYFFATDVHKYKLENYRMSELLKRAFLSEELGDTGIQELNFSIYDTVLVCTFGIEFSSEIEELEESGETGEIIEMIEELNYEQEVYV